MTTSLANSSRGGFVRGTECIVRHDYGTGRSQVTFKKGDIVTILEGTVDPNLFNVQRMTDGKAGVIPIGYVQARGSLKIHEMPWFFGNITREHAEKLLQPRKEGLYLVRESTNYPGDYTLCVVSPFNGKVEHYRVIAKNNQLTVDEEEYFPSLLELIKHYEKDADGLCTRLQQPLVKKQDMSLPSKIFKDAFSKQGWTFAYEDITHEEKIGDGEFGEVHRGKCQGKDVAIKKLKDDSKAAQAFLAEASVMTNLHHRNLVILIGISFVKDSLVILTEYCSKGALVDYLRSRGRAVITQREQLRFARDVSAGMSYLEQQNIVHRDLAARNVLLSDDLCAKVSDFGLAKDFDQLLGPGKLPIKWTAPEAIQKKVFSTKSDVWSFGILLWEIYTFGRNPYPRIPLDQVLTKVLQNYRMEMPDNCPPNVYNLMKQCWYPEPGKRPSFKQISALLKEPDRETEL